MEPHEREALAALKRLIDTAALNGGAVTVSGWRDEMKRVGWGPDNASSWRSAWRRTRAELEKRTLVVIENGAVELVR